MSINLLTLVLGEHECYGIQFLTYVPTFGFEKSLFGIFYQREDNSIWIDVLFFDFKVSL